MHRLVSLLLLLSVLTYCTAYSQSVGIGTSSPHPSAALHIADTNQGVLLPKLTTIQRLAIVNAATGLLVFDTNTNSFWWKEANNWVELISSNIGLRDTDADTGVYVEQTTDEDEIAFELAGTEQARLFGDQLSVSNKLTLGTYTQKGTFTLRGPNDPQFGPTIFMYGNNSDQSESGRIRFAEGTAAGNWRGAFIHYNGSTNLFHLGTNNSSSNSGASDFNAMTIKRVNGFVGINDDNPSKRLSVNGDLKLANGNSVLIETQQNRITLIAGATTVLIDGSGGIVISSATGNIDMSAQNITFTAEDNITMTAGADLELEAGVSIETVAGDNIRTTTQGSIVTTASDNLVLQSGTNTSCIVGGNFQTSAVGSITTTANNDLSFQSGADMSCISGGTLHTTSSSSTIINSNTNLLITGNANTSINGSQVRLNAASSTSPPAARLNDTTNGSKITSSSSTVFIGG